MNPSKDFARDARRPMRIAGAGVVLIATYARASTNPIQPVSQQAAQQANGPCSHTGFFHSPGMGPV